MSLPYKHTLIEKAKELRRNATPQENHLWYDFLRTYPIRFQRQKSIDNFIADFYCHKAKIIIELDGSQHYTEEGMRYDSERSEVLSGLGLMVLRYSNADINSRFAAVCEDIHRHVQKRIVR